jgi:hypothetical protein
LTNIELQLGVGKVTRREIVLNDAALENELGKVEVDDSDLNQLGASLIINFLRFPNLSTCKATHNEGNG